MLHLGACAQNQLLFAEGMQGSPNVCHLEDNCLCILFQVMVSNPHALGFKARLYHYGNTFDGNFKYKLVCVCVGGLDKNPSTHFCLFCVSETWCCFLGQDSLGIYHPALTSQGLDCKNGPPCSTLRASIAVHLEKINLPSPSSLTSLP